MPQALSPERRKIQTRPSLRRIVSKLQKAGKKIVFTNGCFDVLHAGHVSYLERSGRLGDVLVVGVNSDASVRRLKGPGRPINPEGDRAKVIAALESVDYVTLFSEDTPLDLIREIRPDVLVKGADWKKDEIVGVREVESWGGRVKRVSLMAGRSTTKLIEKLGGKEVKIQRSKEKTERSARHANVAPAHH